MRTKGTAFDPPITLARPCNNENALRHEIKRTDPVKGRGEGGERNEHRGGRGGRNKCRERVRERRQTNAGLVEREGGEPAQEVEGGV